MPASLIETLLSQCWRTSDIPIDTLPQIGADRAWVDRLRGQVVAERVIATLRQRYAREVQSDNVVIGIMEDDMYIAHLDWRFAFGYRRREAGASASPSYRSRVRRA